MPFNLTMTSAAYAATGDAFTTCLNGGYGQASGLLPTTGTFTVKCRLWNTSPGALVVAVAQNGAFWIGMNASGVVVASYGSAGNEVSLTSSTTITGGGWYEVALVLDAAAGGKLFVNGNLQASSATTPAAASVNATTPGLFDVRSFRSASTSFDWNGPLDEVAVFSTALHTANYTPSSSPTSNSAAGLVAVWHLDSNGNDSKTSAAATAVTLTGPTTGPSGSASSNFTVGANGDITGTVTVTPSSGGGGGTFTPTTVNISAGTPTATFTYTPASTGAKTISVTNNGGLSNPSNITYTSTAPTIYNRVDATDTIGGQSIMVLVPNSNSAAPYTGSPTKVVLYAHGAGEDQTGLLSDSLKATTVTALLNAGYILAGTNARGDNWGSQSAVDDYAALDKYVRDNYSVSNVVIWSQSMGGLAGLSALAQGKVKAIGWLGTYPVVSLSNIYGLGAFTTAINTAHSITGSGSGTYANRTYGLDPSLFNGFAWRHVPMRMYASAGDTVVPKTANADALATLVTSCCRESVVVVCSGDHGNASHFQPSDTVAFFDRCFATPVALGRPASTKSISITLTTNGTTPAASLTGLKWAFWDQATPNVGEYPTDKGTGESTDGSGVLAITVRTNLATSGIGWLTVTDSDGTTTQSPAYKRFAGPVQVT